MNPKDADLRKLLHYLKLELWNQEAWAFSDVKISLNWGIWGFDRTQKILQWGHFWTEGLVWMIEFVIARSKSPFQHKIIKRNPLCCVQVQGLNKVKQILLYLGSTFFKFGSCGNLPLHVDNMGPTRQKEKSITNGICGSWLMSIHNDCTLLSFSIH